MVYPKLSERVTIYPERERTAKDKGPEVAGIEGLLDILQTFVGEAGGFFKTLMQAATVNPFLGAVLALILADMLVKARIITPTTKTLIQGAALVYLGVNITTDVLAAISNLVQDILPQDILKGISGTSNTQALAPTATTIVYAGDTQALEALLAKLAKK